MVVGLLKEYWKRGNTLCILDIRSSFLRSFSIYGHRHTFFLHKTCEVKRRLQQWPYLSLTLFQRRRSFVHTSKASNLFDFSRKNCTIFFRNGSINKIVCLIGWMCSDTFITLNKIFVLRFYIYFQFWILAVEIVKICLLY